MQSNQNNTDNTNINNNSDTIINNKSKPNVDGKVTKDRHELDINQTRSPDSRQTPLDPSTLLLDSDISEISPVDPHLFSIPKICFDPIKPEGSDPVTTTSKALLTDQFDSSNLELATADMSDNASNSHAKSKQLSTVELTSALGIQPQQRTRRTWTPQEDSKLRTLVAEWGDQRGKNSHWDKISESMEGRTSKDCRKRWFHSLDPTLKRGRWTADEDRILIEAYESYGPAWNRIAQLISGRTDDQCSKRYNDVLDPNVQNRLRQWTKEEDDLLIKMFQEHGTQWKIIASKMEGRTGLTCRNRWRKLAASSLTKTKKLNSGVKAFGNAKNKVPFKSISVGSQKNLGTGGNSNADNLNRFTPDNTSGQSSNKSTPQPSIMSPDLSPVAGFTTNTSSGPVSLRSNRSSNISTGYPRIETHKVGNGFLNHTQNGLDDPATEPDSNISLSRLVQLDHGSRFKLHQNHQQNRLELDNSVLDGLLHDSEKSALLPGVPFVNNDLENKNSTRNPTYKPTNQTDHRQHRTSGNNNTSMDSMKTPSRYTRTSLKSHFTFSIDNTNDMYSRTNYDSNNSFNEPHRYRRVDNADNHPNKYSFNGLGKRTRNSQDDYNYPSESLKQEDVAAIVQAAKANGVAVVIHQHNYYNHYHNYHYQDQDETRGQGSRNGFGDTNNNTDSINTQQHRNNGVGMDDHPMDLDNDKPMMDYRTGYKFSDSDRSNRRYSGGTQRGSIPFGSTNEALSLSNILNTSAESTPGINSESNMNSGMRNGVPLLAGGSVDLGIGNRLTESSQPCNNCGNVDDNTHHNHDTDNINSSSNTDRTKFLHLSVHPHFKELEQIDMDTDPFGWIPSLANANGNNTNSLSYEEIPFNPS